jgi:uncharacterized lipoprotein YbaY
MRFSFSGPGALLALVVSVWLALPAGAQEQEEGQGGISTPLLSRCAGKFGATLRAGDQAFPFLELAGVPWLKIERTDQNVEGAHIVTVVTGIGVRSRRRGEVAGLRYRCLIDNKGVAVSFTWNDLLPQNSEALPTGIVLRGSALYQPKRPLPPGAELRVQLFDRAAEPPVLLAESVVRSSWVDPIPFTLRVPSDMKLQDRKLAIDARLSLGRLVLYRLKEPHGLALDRLMQPITITMDAPEPGSAPH